MSMARTADPGPAFHRVLARSSIEVIPLKGADETVARMPVERPVTITCSPKFGLDRTLEHVTCARRAGHRVVPHLAARMVVDRRQLRDFVSRIVDLGVDDLYVVGGDGATPVGAFSEASDLLEELREFDHGLRRLGVGCYPEGHPKIPDGLLLDALVRKQAYADYMVSQLCFDAGALADWLRMVRDAGITLPLRVGVAAPLQTRKLIELSLRIGVGQSVRFLSKQHGIVGNLLLGRTYEPLGLVHELASQISFEEQAVEGLHLFSFNQVEATLDWLARASGRSPSGLSPI
ncbi:methylenetetrahydrofolate reductase [Nocardioides sp. LMS-CY]|uniref:methylenetetrahydrofolate reductase n=1 Tax=Nocardioides sp. (strain LMS-CY) TaxID=2840457 RepID=UPI001BFFFFBB|nr:methylenetetrahydrofolate reductase [Nocardioides sp. LMS-CY]QWF20495.1 methylenetetrahydrofolate reductase [Nocardioides sp. LMS-CY]